MAVSLHSDCRGAITWDGETCEAQQHVLWRKSPHSRPNSVVEAVGRGPLCAWEQTSRAVAIHQSDSQQAPKKHIDRTLDVLGLNSAVAYGCPPPKTTKTPSRPWSLGVLDRPPLAAAKFPTGRDCCETGGRAAS